MAAGTLLFGVGATKASTSWLYDYLSGHPGCHLRTIKELHYFDTRTPGGTRAAILEHKTTLDGLKPRLAAAPTERMLRRCHDLRAWLSVLRAPAEDTAPYLAYLGDGAGGRLVADVTPAYALLPVERLRMMAGLLPDVRFLYLLRDPLARLWSHVRMLAMRAGGDHAEGAAGILDDVLAGRQKGVMERGDYAGALARLEEAVAPGRLLVMFQEVLLTPPGLAQVCDFLGIARHPGDFGRTVHGGVPLAMTAHQAVRARAALRPQYDEVLARFGQVPAAWARNMNEGVA